MKEATMLLSLLQVGVVLLVALSLGWWRTETQRRNGQSWECLIGRLRKDCHGHELSAHFLWREGLSAGPEETWERLGGARGLWAMFQNARVMMEMAEFAARRCGVDAALVETLRCDAAQIRLCVLRAMAQCAVGRADESLRLRAFQAASIYTGMAARTVELLRNHAAAALPEFVAAM